MARALARKQISVLSMAVGVLGLGFIYHFPVLYMSTCENVGRLVGEYFTSFLNMIIA